MLIKQHETEHVRQIQASRVSNVRLCHKNIVQFTAMFRTELKRATYIMSSAKCDQLINCFKFEMAHTHTHTHTWRNDIIRAFQTLLKSD